MTSFDPLSYDPLPDEQRHAKPATEHTKRTNAAVLEALPFNNRQSFADAQRGFIATLAPLTIARDNGATAYDLAEFGFLDSTAPASVNPSLWRQAQLNAQHNGLFEVVDGIYQVRSYDIANMTLIRGSDGWIIIDPLTSTESARAALALANEHLGERPVTAVLFTHSHVDHFAGILGVYDPTAHPRKDIPIIAPEHFVQEALSENVLAGNVMGRRATYMYGNLLKPGATGFVTTGLGAALSMGSTGFIVPNDFIKATGETRTVDGIEFVFQMTPGTEAPAEFVFYLPQFKALCMSEITSHHMHNVYTLRGAQVRDALAWSAQINESIELFGQKLEVQFASHHWPIWGTSAVNEYLEKQRDLYKYVHDQTLRWANKGFTKEEIAERIELPPSLGQEFYNRDYYGTVHHNSRGVYVKYLGYFNGNPAHLHPLPPSESGRRYLDFMGGENAVVEKASSSFDQGDYRWVVEVLNHVMMCNPQHASARALMADALEQLGYQAESGPWRNFYLCGALELRNGLPKGSNYRASPGIAAGMPLENIFQMLAVRIMPEYLQDAPLAVDATLTDTGETWQIRVKHCVLRATPGLSESAATCKIQLPTIDFKYLLLGHTSLDELSAKDSVSLLGDDLAKLLACLDEFPRRFPIVTARASG
jgi:alkyl sulfatase BDS1-like metallo-beta-lactamase superfamily hydrolase